MPVVPVYHPRRDARRAVKQGYPRRDGTVRLCRSVDAIERLLQQCLVDAIVIDVKAAPDAARALASQYPAIPVFALSPFKPGDPLVRRPRHQTVVHAGYERNRLTGFAEVQQRSETLDLEPNFAGSTYPNPGYAVFNAGLSVTLTKNVDVFVRSLNLSDREYEEVLGYPALRRSGIVGVRVAASR